MSNRTSPVGPGTDASVRSIALIGMPGSGKSTLGILLAKKLGWHFLDTDIGIQTRAERPYSRSSTIGAICI